MQAGLLALLATAAVWMRTPETSNFDFCTYYAAGSLVVEGSAATVYDIPRLKARHHQIHPGPRGIGPFFYSPLYLLPASLFARLPFAAAEAASRLFGAVCLAFGLGFVLLRCSDWRWRAGIAAAFPLSHPAWVQLIYLNWTFLLFALVAAGWWLVGRRLDTGWRDLAAASLFALAIHLKVYLALLVVALFLAGRRRLVAATAVVCLALALLSLPVVGIDSWRGYLGGFVDAASAGLTPFYNQVSIQATLARQVSEPRSWVSPRAPVDLFALRYLFLATLPLYLWGAARLRRSLDATIAFTLAYLLLCVPQIWDHMELLLFLLLPALAPRYRIVLTLMLAASALYSPLLQPKLLLALRGELEPNAVRALLLFFPSLNLLALGASLDRTGAGVGTGEGESPAQPEVPGGRGATR